MSSAAVRLPLAEAETLAQEVVGLIAHACTRIEIAGSIRRRNPDCGDIEIVFIPLITQEKDPADLFGEATIDRNHEWEAINHLRTHGIVADRLSKDGHACFGEKWQRLTYKGFGVDLFAADAETWGVTLAIRTGPADFSRQLVTAKAEGGFMLMGQHMKGWRVIDRGVALPTPEEQDVFTALEMEWIRPEDRR